MIQFDRIYIEISNVCNLQCSFCPEVLRPKKLMTPEQFRKILIKIKPYTKAVTLHVMGEPLAHPKFLEFLDLLEEFTIPLILTSNGQLLHRHQDRILSSTIIKQINFSIHSFFDNFPDREITDYLKAITDFSIKFTEANQKSFINYRLWNLSSPNSLLESRNQKIYTELSDLFQNLELPNSIDIRERKSYRLDRHIKLNFDTQFEWPSLNSKSPNHDGFCYGLKNQLAILTEGTVVPCCLDKEAVINLGSIFETDLIDIL